MPGLDVDYEKPLLQYRIDRAAFWIVRNQGLSSQDIWEYCRSRYGLNYLETKMAREIAWDLLAEWP